ncbi:HAD family phosphatase [Amnibacterium sp. CER49]|uniref:HAD family hydrolase n=1 Tax=Amnibacterium sp. CER49 TaxID=3039161 RepID=UPI00244A1960|nr:HAD family phosphatase [Amnibacterium sp. CER49]MDH2444637.1 HAD family phosphatase [Amnibacterium sp. CER49]
MPAADVPAAVLWDLDGTLVDTEPHWMAAETDLVSGFGGTWTHEQALTLVGQDLGASARILQRHGVDLPADEIVDRLTSRVIDRLEHGVTWRPGALALLAELADADVPAALVTMSVRRMADAVVAAMPFPVFSVVVAGDEVLHPKPHPYPYLRAAELLGVAAGACVAIEDSPPGLTSAVAAGTAAVGVPNTVPLPSGEAWTIWPTLEGRHLDDLAALAAAR